jgi:hypothetical protein
VLNAIPATAGAVSNSYLSATTGTGAVALASLPTFTTTIGVGGATASASGSGITFPATQSASTDANTLDDYEEGSWTPNISISGSTTGIVLAVTNGTYTKIGNCVTAKAYISISNKGSNTGGVNWINLPFNSNSDANSYACVNQWTYNTAATITALRGYIGINSTAITINKDNTTTFSGTDLINGTEMMLNVTYFV